MSPADVARALRGRRIGRGKWMAKCPAHHEKTGSLSITDMGKGKTRLHCFGGCHQLDVLKAAGLTWKDLRPDGDVGTEIKGAKLKRIQRQYGVMQWVAYLEPEKRRYWEAAMRRVMREMEPLYWEVMPDKERVERATAFEIRDYKNKRLDWLYGRRDGVHTAAASTGKSASEIRQDGIRGGPRHLSTGGLQARRGDDLGSRQHLG